MNDLLVKIRNAIKNGVSEKYLKTRFEDGENELINDFNKSIKGFCVPSKDTDITKLRSQS